MIGRSRSGNHHNAAHEVDDGECSMSLVRVVCARSILIFSALMAELQSPAVGSKTDRLLASASAAGRTGGTKTSGASYALLL